MNCGFCVFSRIYCWRLNGLSQRLCNNCSTHKHTDTPTITTFWRQGKQGSIHGKTVQVLPEAHVDRWHRIRFATRFACSKVVTQPDGAHTKPMGHSIHKGRIHRSSDLRTKQNRTVRRSRKLWWLCWHGSTVEQRTRISPVPVPPTQNPTSASVSLRHRSGASWDSLSFPSPFRMLFPVGRWGSVAAIMVGAELHRRKATAGATAQGYAGYALTQEGKNEYFMYFNHPQPTHPARQWIVGEFAWDCRMASTGGTIVKRLHKHRNPSEIPPANVSTGSIAPWCPWCHTPFWQCYTMRFAWWLQRGINNK